jgi:DNA-binding response OmpR family regulator
MEPYRAEDGAKVRADGVIVKPFEATDLLAVVKKMAEKVAPAEAHVAPEA